MLIRSVPHMKYSLILLLAVFSSGLVAQEKWSLEKCVEQALNNNLQIKQSRISSDIAKTRYHEAKLDLLPTVNAQAIHGYNWGQTIDPFTNQFATNRVRNNSFGVSSSITLFGGFQKWNTIKSNKFEFLASQADVRSTQNQVALSVANAYLQVLLAEEFTGIAVQQLEQSQAQFNRIEKLVEVGQLPISSLLDVKAQKANDELNLVNQKNQRDLAYLQLYQLLQIEEGKSFVVKEPDLDALSFSLMQQSPNEVYETALDEMPQIEAAEYRHMGAEAGVDASLGAFAPRITMNGSYGTGYSGANRIPAGTADTSLVPFGFTETGDQVFVPDVSFSRFETKDFGDQLDDNLNQSLSFSLVIPIFNGNKTRYGYKRARMNNAQSHYQLIEAKNQLKQDIQTAYQDALSALKSFEASKEAVEASEQAFQNAQTRYDQNLINAVDYNDARIQFVQARSDLARAKYNYVFKVKVLDFYKGEDLTLK